MLLFVHFDFDPDGFFRDTVRRVGSRRCCGILDTEGGISAACAGSTCRAHLIAGECNKSFEYPLLEAMDIPSVRGSAAV
jgi:hypothetical protein